MNLAVGVIIGGAFGKIVESIVGDIIMPIIGPGRGKKVRAVRAYGSFLTIVVNFLIMAFFVFMLVRWVSSLMPAKVEAPAGPTEVDLLKDIRAALVNRR